MTSQDKAKVGGALHALATLFEREFSDELAALYLVALGDLPADVLVGACRRAMRELKFFPKPAELRELAGAQAPRGTGAALLALETVRRVIRQHGRRGTFDFGEPMIHAAVRAFGGWRAICDSDPTWTAKRWTEAWDSLEGSALPPHVTAPIEGGEDGPLRRIEPPAAAPALEAAPAPRALTGGRS